MRVCVCVRAHVRGSMCSEATAVHVCAKQCIGHVQTAVCCTLCAHARPNQATCRRSLVIVRCSTVQQVQQSTEQKEKRRQKESSDERKSSNEKACRSKSGWSTHADWEGRVAGVGRVACNVRRTSAQHACHTAGLLLLSCSPLSTLVHVPTTRII